MKQRLLLILSLLLMVAMSQAAPVDANKAKDKALQFLSGKQAKARGMEQGTTPDVQLVTSEGDSYYVFNVGQQNGFVIVSGDDRAPEILGYSDSGTFDTQDIPENMRAWLQGYAEQIQLLDQVEAPAAARAAISLRETPWTAIAPLIQTKWDQHEPYNNDVSPNVTGCVATAIAQVMYYHKWPQGATTAIPGYSNRSGLSSTTFDWNNMQKEYFGSESESANAAVAELMQYCGWSVEMNYGTGSSSAQAIKAVNAFKNYFGYDQNIRSVKRSYYSIDEWENIIYEEIKNGRPVMYGGSTVGGAAHEFICDGYDGDGKFHFNWGWGGRYNGFFVIWSANPRGSGTGGSNTSDGYSSDQSAIIGIQKPTGNPAVSEKEQLTVTNLKVYNNQISYTRNSVNEDFKVFLNSTTINATGASMTAMAGFALYNSEGNSEGVILQDNTWISYGAGASYSFNNKFYEASFGQGKTGKYSIVPIYRIYNSSDGWHVDNKADQFYIEATMTETTLTLRVLPIVDLIVKKVEYIGTCMANIPLEVKVTIMNNGSEYNGELYLLRSNNTGYSSAETVALRAGEETDVYFHYATSYSGTETYRICTYNGSYNTLPGGTGTQTIAAYSTTDNVNLDFTTEIKNAIAGDKILGNKFSATVTVTNNTQETYLGAEIGLKYVYQDEYYIYTKMKHYDNIRLLPGQSDTYNLTFDMTYGTKYTISFYQAKGGEQVTKGKEYVLTATDGIAATLADGTVEIIEKGSTLNITPAVTSVDLRGVTTVTSINTDNSDSNCIFLVDENADISGLEDNINVIKGTTAANIQLSDDSENGFVAPINFTANAISYQRTFTAGTDGNGSGWTTIVLPYDVEKVMVDDHEIDWFHSSNDTGKNFWLRKLVSDGDLSVTFDYVDELKANTPYIIAVPGDKWGSQWSLVGKTLKFIGSNASIIKDATAEEEGDHYRFTGTTTKQQLESVYTLNAAGSSFTLGNATVDPFRAYFRAIGSNSRAIDLQILSAGNQATAITLPDVEPLQTGEIYSIDGRMMGTSIESLPKGIYVVDGKKVVK